MRAVVKLTRAALFAGATLLVPACGGPQQKKADNDTVAEPDAGAPGGAVKKRDGDEKDGEEKDDEREIEELDEQEFRGGGDCTPDGQCPPYGAPPSADDRIV